MAPDPPSNLAGTQGVVDCSRRRGVGIREEMTVGRERKRRGAVTKAAANRERVDAGRDQCACMAVA